MPMTPTRTETFQPMKTTLPSSSLQIRRPVRREVRKYHAPIMAVERKPNMTALTCSWRRREKIRGGHEIASGKTNSIASSTPMLVPKTSQKAAERKKLRAVLSSARNSRSNNVAR